MIEELQETVAFVWCGEDGDLVVEDLDAGVPLFADEATFARCGCYEAKDRSAVGGGAGRERERCSVGEDDLGEADDGDVEGGEVTVEAGVDALGVV